MMTELKRCPFCGGEAQMRQSIDERNGRVSWQAKCTNTLNCIGNFINVWEYTEERAANAWNMRVIDAKCSLSKPNTNADRIRSMTDEELAEFLFRTFGKAAWCLDNDCTSEESCIPCWLEWLKQESEKPNAKTN